MLRQRYCRVGVIDVVERGQGLHSVFGVIIVVSLMSCSPRSADRSSRSKNDYQHFVCPDHLSEDTMKVLGISKGLEVQKELLVKKWQSLGYTVTESRYHVFEPECSEVALTGQYVLKVTIGWNVEKTLFKRYAVHFDERGHIDRIEARYHGGR